jgi:hypothetical protein
MIHFTAGEKRISFIATLFPSRYIQYPPGCLTLDATEHGIRSLTVFFILKCLNKTGNVQSARIRNKARNI